MVAEVEIVEKNGAGGTATNKAGQNVHFKAADNSDADFQDDITVPGAGSTFSYEKWIRFKFISAPDTQIENLAFYTDGGNNYGTGVSLWAKTSASYSTPTQPASSAGFTDGFTYTESSTLSMGAGPYTGTGEKGDHVVLCIEVASTASTGVLPEEKFTFTYDES